MKLRDFSRRPSTTTEGTVKKKKKSMKLGKTPDHLREAREEDSEDEPRRKKKVSADEGADWATTDATAIAGQIETNNTMSSQNRPPEFFMKPGEKKRIRFRSDEPIASFYQYGTKINGQYKDFTRPPAGQLNLFEKKKLNCSLKVLWEVIDIDGYQTRAGDRVRFAPKFFRIGTRLNSQIEAIKEQYGTLKNRIIVITRGKQGGTATSYTLLPESRTKPHPKELAAERLKPKWREFYAPPSPQVQKSLIGSVSDPNARDTDDDIPY